MLSFQSVRKTFRLGDEFWTFGPLSCDISRGESLAILGKSGSGKSTFLHLASGFLSPDEGDIFFENHNFRNFSDRNFEIFRNKNIGFVFQEFFLFPEFSLLENVAMPLLVRGLSRKEAFVSAEKSLTEVGLLQKKNNRPAELSGGQRQRGAIARAIIGNPKMLFADEPTGNLDAETGKMIIALLERIHREKKMTLVLVTHDRILAGKCEKIMEIADGKRILSSKKEG